MERNSHCGEIEDDGVQVRFCLVRCSFGFGSSVSRAGVVPWSIAKLDLAHIFSSPHVFSNVVNKNGVDDGAVGVEIALLKSIDEDAWSWRNDFNIWTDDSSSGQRQENFALFLAVRGFFLHNGLPKEGPSRVGNTNQKEE